MKEVTRSITVDLMRRGNVRIVFAKQNDVNSRRLHIRLTEDGRPYPVSKNARVLINYLRPDNQSGANEATVLDDGSIEATLSLWALSIVGEVHCSISIFENDAKLSSDDIILDVTKSLYNGKDITPQVESAFISYINMLNRALTTEEERIAAENIRRSNEEARIAAEEKRVTNATAQSSRLEKMITEVTQTLESVETMQDGIEEKENLRDSTESARSIAESKRAVAEDAREASENARKEAEEARIAAELQRKEDFAQYGKAEHIIFTDHSSKFQSENVEGALGEIGATLDSLNNEIANTKSDVDDAKQTVLNSLGIKGRIIIPTSAWSDAFDATVLIDEITENDLVNVFPATSSDKSIINEAEIFASPETNGNTILFSAKRKPSRDIALCYFITRGKAV